LGRHYDSIEYYDEIIETYRKDPCRSRTIFANKAIECYNKAIKKYPNNTDLWYNKGLFLYLCPGHDKMEQALTCYDKIIEINPNHAKGWIKKGLIHEEWESPTEAIKCYDKAIETNSNYENNAAADVWLHLCYALMYHHDKIEQALGCINNKKIRIIDAEMLIKFVSPILANLAKMIQHKQSQTETLEKALDCINKAIEYDSKYAGNPYIWTSKGSILHSLERYEEVIKCYDKALEIDPNYNSVLSYKQNLLQKLGKDEDARKCFDQQQGEKYQRIKFDGRFLDSIINEWW
jgi:tetratricopeptide (TPR) repeat protein